MSDVTVVRKLLALADEFDFIHREGGDVDVPEGSRYVQISDTMMKNFASEMRKCAIEIRNGH